MSDFEILVNEYNKTKKLFDAGQNPLEQIDVVAKIAIAILNKEAKRSNQGKLSGINGTTKNYDIFSKAPNKISRPINTKLYVNEAIFDKLWKNRVIDQNLSGDIKKTSLDFDMAVYTAVTAFACCYDLYKTSSRKTPGTFFEIVVGSILASFTGMNRGKQISLPDSRFKVPTDILLINDNGANLVIPTKITTQERIVQVWSQQTILDNAYEPETYIAVPVFLSELQRDGSKGVKEICVPGQVGLFQRYLTEITCHYFDEFLRRKPYS